MRPWPRHPLIYEINTWVWLGEMSTRLRRAITLANVPADEWERLAAIGADAVWFMGVWERSPAGIRVALGNQGLMADFRRALPDVQTADIVGSPYCVRDYVVDNHLGGPHGLAVARRALAERGVRLILDFVPNHVAPDHPWVAAHPEYFVRGNTEDLGRDPGGFYAAGENVIACGRDPYFPAWPDVLQLNAFNPGLRKAAVETVTDISSQCDGVRCDMAMLLLNHIFERTWGERAGVKPESDYWMSLIPAVKVSRPDFKFIAEAYWDLEWELQQQGFDYCYDKRLYDRLEHGPGESVRQHLLADPAYQSRLVRFIENHDEPRAASVFAPAQARAAAVISLTLIGARLLHEGQREGMKTRLPVFLSRRPVEPVDPDLSRFYERLLGVVTSSALRDGEWRLCDRTGWPDNQSCMNILAWSWDHGTDRYLIVVNYSNAPAQGLIRVPLDELKGKSWQLLDVFTGQSLERSGDDMWKGDLYVDLPAWGLHFFQLRIDSHTSPSKR